MYLLANQWLKTTTRNDPKGYATTFVTTLDHQERNDKRPEKKQQDKSDEESKKREKDLSKIKCYACGEMGHYANKCPSRQTDSNENEEQEQEETRSSHVTWNANTLTTYQVNAVQQKTFGPKDVLLDNQANISVVRPELLRDVFDLRSCVMCRMQSRKGKLMVWVDTSSR